MVESDRTVSAGKRTVPVEARRSAARCRCSRTGLDSGFRVNERYGSTHILWSQEEEKKTNSRQVCFYLINMLC